MPRNVRIPKEPKEPNDSKTRESATEAADWNDDRRKWLMQAMKTVLVDQEFVLSKSKPDAGITSTQWDHIVAVYNDLSKNSYVKSQLQSQLQWLKTRYTTFKKIKNTSGAGWDDEKKIILLDPATWRGFIDVHKEAKEFVDKPFPLYDDLHELFGGSTATGNGAKSSTGVSAGGSSSSDSSPSSTTSISSSPSKRHRGEMGSFLEKFMDRVDGWMEASEAPPTKQATTTVDPSVLDEVMAVIDSLEELSAQCRVKSKMHFEESARQRLCDMFLKMTHEEKVIMCESL
jgi:hypothetical protein